MDALHEHATATHRRRRRPLPPRRLRDERLIERKELHVPDVHQHSEDDQLHNDVVAFVGVVEDLS